MYLLGKSFQKDDTSNHFHRSSKKEIEEPVTSKEIRSHVDSKICETDHQPEMKKKILVSNF